MSFRRRALVVAALTLLLFPGATAAGEECIVLEDFSAGAIGDLPPGWKLRSSEGRGVYTLREEGGRRYLHAASTGIGIQAAKEITWDLGRYPVLAWSWRPVELPKGADERNAKTNDSALAVYGVFPYRMGSVKSVKYIWSEVMPAGAPLTSNMGLTQVRVLRTGTAGLGQWTGERVDLLDDYRKRFGASDTPKPAGIAVLTDADDTKSRAQGDYASFRACAP